MNRTIIEPFILGFLNDTPYRIFMDDNKKYVFRYYKLPPNLVRGGYYEINTNEPFIEHIEDNLVCLLRECLMSTYGKKAVNELNTKFNARK